MNFKLIPYLDYFFPPKNLNSVLTDTDYPKLLASYKYDLNFRGSCL